MRISSTLILATAIGLAAPAAAAPRAAAAPKPTLRGFFKAVGAQQGHSWDRVSRLNVKAFLQYHKTGKLPVKDPQKVIRWTLNSVKYDLGQLEQLAKQTAPVAQRRDLRGRFYSAGTGSFILAVGGAQFSSEYQPNKSLEPMKKLYETFGSVVRQISAAKGYAAAHPEQPALADSVGKLAARASKVMAAYGHDKLSNKAGVRDQLQIDRGVPGMVGDSIAAVERSLVALPGQLKELQAASTKAR